MKSIIFSLILLLSIPGFAQKKKEIRFLYAKNASEINFTISPDSTRASFSIKTFGEISTGKTDSETSTFFGFSHRKATTIRSLPSVTLEEYYADPSKYVLSQRIYLIVPFTDKIFAIWKCSVLGAK